MLPPIHPQPYPTSSFDTNPVTFMQDQSNEFTNHFHGTHYKPIKPRRRRKRKLAETDIDDTNPLSNDKKATILSMTKPGEKEMDSESMSLQFMRPSTKRLRTNQMKHSKDQIHVDSRLEHNIHCHDPSSPPKQRSTNLSATKGKEELEYDQQERIETPYHHPYHWERSLSPQNRDKSPEDMMNELNLNGFRMRNSDNDGNSEWRQSIESQLMNARSQTPSQTQKLCQRIANTSGLGRDVLMAKLRRQLPTETFDEICKMMEGNQQNE